MTLSEALDNIQCDNHQEGLYALWVKCSLPDVGEHQNVVGSNACTVFISHRKGVLCPPDWVDETDPLEISAKLLYRIPL